MGKTRYEIRVRGRLGKALLTAVPDLDAAIEPPQTVTVLRGDLTDQTELHAILQTLAGLGIELIEVRRLSTNPLPPVPRGSLAHVQLAARTPGAVAPVAPVMPGPRGSDATR